jgi:gliding motility-associated-like protein
MTHHYRTPNSLPNGDGFNDNWKIKFSDNEIGLSIQLFDRYGKLIKELQIT